MTRKWRDEFDEKVKDYQQRQQGRGGATETRDGRRQRRR